MMIKIGILGYGNLGKGVECAIKHNPDMELKAVFTRRDPSSLSILTEGAKVYSVADAPAMKDEIDVLIICGGLSLIHICVGLADVDIKDHIKNSFLWVWTFSIICMLIGVIVGIIPL